MSHRSDRMIQIVMLVLAIVLLGSCAMIIGDMDYADAAAPIPTRRPIKTPTSAPPEEYFTFVPFVAKDGEYRPTNAPTEQPLPTHAPTEEPYGPDSRQACEEYAVYGQDNFSLFCCDVWLVACAPTPTPVVEQCRSVAIMEPGKLEELSSFCCEVYGLMCEVP